MIPHGGRKLKRRELEARVGRLEQVGGLRRTRLVEGPEDGVEQIEVRTGAGLRFLVQPHRGLDIGLAEYAGSALTWQAPNGEVHPAYYNEDGNAWLRTASGGLVMTCGMLQAGAACEDHGEKLGLHGRTHHIAATEVSANGTWINDVYEMRVSGSVREARLFGENLVRHRTIWARLGENRLCVRDRIENIGGSASPLMILYHCNFGFPLMTEDTHIEFPSHRVTPREDTTPLEGYDRWHAPVADYAERVYFHSDFRVEKSAAGRHLAEVRIRNPHFPVGAQARPVTVRVRWDVTTLPHLIEWKNPGFGGHVLGIEPANCLVMGRAAERSARRLEMLEPGDSRETFLEILVEE